MLTPHEPELLRRHRLNHQLELQMLGAGELWHPMSEREYRGLLLEGLEQIDRELAGEYPAWRPDPDEPPSWNGMDGEAADEWP
jgi:hypothetical protein